MKLTPHRSSYEGKVRKIPSKKDNFGLSKSEFQMSVENLKAGINDILTKHIAHQIPDTISYLGKRFSLSRQVSYDICMSTLLKFREKLIQDKIQYGNLRFLYTRMCINHYFDAEKKRKQTDAAVHTFLELNTGNFNQEVFYKRLDTVVDDLDKEQQTLIDNIYRSGKSMENVAADLNISYAALRKKKQRLLKKMKEMYFKKRVI